MSNIQQPKFYIVKILYCLLFFLITSCTSNKPQYPDKLSMALSAADENRKELEKVLEFYSSVKPDSLKYKAACFLIENMAWHYSYSDTSLVTGYYDIIDSISVLENKNALFDSIRDKYKDVSFDTKRQPDLKYITAEYLIKNIEYSFDIWLNGNWAKHIDFDDFCEYILPYKVTELQILDNWKEYFSDYAGWSLDHLQYGDMFKYSSYKACEAVLKELRDKVSIWIIQTEGIPIYRMRTLTYIPYGSCNDYCNLSTAVMRARGIPCAIDYTPQWPFRSLGHSWCVLLNNRGKHTVFDVSESVPGYPHKEDHKFAKIFRKTYAVNDELYEMHKEEKYIPEEFSDICFKDVTDEYMLTQNIKVKLQNNKDTQYAYLSVFDNQRWIPIHWGKIANDEVEFTKMGRDVVYLPVCYGVNGVYAVNDPIKITSKGEIFPLTVDKINRQKMILYRKHPYLHDPFFSTMRIIGGKIQASDNKDFKNCKTFYTIDKPSSNYEEVDINQSNQKFRYWRYLAPDHSFGNIAELAFFEKDSILPIEGKIIGTEGSLFNDPNKTMKAVFDKDPLTSFDIPVDSGCWVGMDFGSEVNIGKIRYLPRGDGNNIEMGDEYELFYWGTNWVTLGKQQATGTFLIYENCPANTLFLLKNHSRGKEERIFTYENGKQVWW